MPVRPFLALVALGLCGGQTSSSVAALTACPADPRLAELVAASDIVLIGAMDVPSQRLAEEAQKSAPGYVDITIRIDRALKGGAPENAILVFYPRDAPYKPSVNAVLGLANAPALLFLTRGEPGLYFAGHSPDALKPATGQDVRAVELEVARQMRILGLWRADPGLPHFAEVRALIGQLGRVAGKEQQQVFTRLEALGMSAVPAIIAQMDDRRPLKTAAITLANHASDAFEGTRHYSPEQVVDGLAAVLSQLTGASFGTIENGGSARERDAAIAGWRVYASDLGCSRRG